MMEPRTERQARLAFMFVGGTHQAMHLAPVAAALHAEGAARPTAFARSGEDAAYLKTLFAQLGAPDLPVEAMTLPPGVAAIGRVSPRIAPMKVPRLIWWRRRLSRFDAIISTERTTTVLKRMPGRSPPLIHIPHGAGDRAKGFEPRLALFDHVIAAGPKDRRRMIECGLVAPDRCSVAGYVKLAGVRLIDPRPRPTGLDPGRPTILYNPHFSRELGSWDRMGLATIDAIVADGRFNLIVAPHVRLHDRLDGCEAAAVAARAAPGRVLIDLGSPRSFDMSYTRAADLYLGDVSSQVYEFVATPRPCVFLDPGAASWQGNPDYAMWAFGEVCRDVPSALAALHRAGRDHLRYVDVQTSAVADAFWTTGDAAPMIAGRQILEAIAAFGSTG